MSLEIPPTEIPLRLTPGQFMALKRLANTGRYGDTVHEVIRYFIARGLEAFETAHKGKG